MQGGLFARNHGLGRGSGFRLLARGFRRSGGGHVDSGVGSKWRPLSHIPEDNSVKCGRGLAPDSGVTVKNIETDPPLSGASPLPQRQKKRPGGLFFHAN
ncbi:hypothetical protein VO64_4176 [Pseudomonas synxantha]|uniref:Uncharacterized protein n=1 Tax=Pseudomonas synxantha TaxID=47883 RepID=A0AAU8TR03_9PSED|nr:hypothetical protein VO64_4176 [Pseudomonas synxantha]